MKICVGVTGSIAAYRSPDLVKLLVGAGHEVRVIATQSALQFTTPRTLETFSGHRVLSNDAFDPHHVGTDHISVARWADCVVVYGATATFLARYASGLAEDFLTLQLLATRAPVFVVPAMNPTMWLHPAVQANVRLLVSRGVKMIGPVEGQVACGESGTGHVAELEQILEVLRSEHMLPRGVPLPDLSGKKILISAGPMRSSLDPARTLQNRSSGRMGLALARAAREAGALVSVLLGPVSTELRKAFEEFDLHFYETPQEYGSSLAQLFARCDVFFSAAAVLDFEFVTQNEKMDRARLSGPELTLPIRPVKDFVAECARQKKPGQMIVAFAAEVAKDPENLVKRAQEKLEKKKADAIVANPIAEGRGPDSETNEVWILGIEREPVHLGPAPKEELAAPILRALFRPSR